jgi:hypothetical protein
MKQYDLIILSISPIWRRVELEKIPCFEALRDYTQNLMGRKVIESIILAPVREVNE